MNGEIAKVKLDGAKLDGEPEVFLESNGIRFTPDGEYIIFNSLDNGKLYRMTPPPAGTPEERVIKKIKGVTRDQLGDADGLEFLNSDTLYSVDNATSEFDGSPERIVKLRLSDNYTKAEVLNETKNPEFHSPTAAALAPKGRLLIPQSEFFEPDMDPRFFVTSIPRP